MGNQYLEAWGWDRKIIEPWHEISNNVVSVTSKGSDLPARMRSLIRAFASHLNILLILSYWLNIVWFLSLKGGCTCSSESTHVKMPHCWKSHVAAQTSLLITVCHHSASPMMPNSDPQDWFFFYPFLALMIDSYYLSWVWGVDIKFPPENHWQMSCDMWFQTIRNLTSVDLHEPVQPPFKLRNSKLCPVSSFTVIVY